MDDCARLVLRDLLVKCFSLYSVFSSPVFSSSFYHLPIERQGPLSNSRHKMIRSILTTDVALAAIQHADAQDVEATTSIPLTTPATIITAPSSSTTPIDTAAWVSGQSRAASSRASVSSLLGPFYKDILFIPGATHGDWISAISSTAHAGGTTVWAVYWEEYYTDSAER